MLFTSSWQPNSSQTNTNKKINKANFQNQCVPCSSSHSGLPYIPLLVLDIGNRIMGGQRVEAWFSHVTP
jgi:hypothetical protein